LWPKELGIPKDHVICHVTLLGGAFGRKSRPDYVARPPCSRRKWAVPSRCVDREDDIKFDYYNTVAAMYMKAALDPKDDDGMANSGPVFPPIHLHL